MAFILDLRTGAPPEEQVKYLKEQLEMHFSEDTERLTEEEIDEICKYLGNYIGGGSSGGGGSVTVVVDYNELLNRPSIEGVLLTGNKTYEDLNLQGITNIELEEMLV